ncbi:MULTISPECIES: SAM hydrolase/SAM-dependent halogenase family protein [Persicobacter]|uniref:SAM-dependent chlorinase/fluorinase n=1 Tax=Persicobacter diffluens TaxID=981 RepID=A0AAN5AJK9_9BACT|nr:SAM-dependent chlorinase/fluorinase [Persicobacter sp. CCB-QB2]GJM61149.1 hypothetical protein PEDI_17010 [Persicobacter diffluens]
MALITFLSDFGVSDHYVAAVKAKILKFFPAAQIIDITHAIKPFDIIHGSHVLGAVFRDFPEGTIHLFGVDSFANENTRHIAVKLEGHFFVGPDNGLLSQISAEAPKGMVELTEVGEEKSPFPLKDICAEAVAKLASGSGLPAVGTYTSDLKRFVSRKPRVGADLIIGHVLHVDAYGNLITNIKREDFETRASKMTYNIRVAREQFQHVHGSIAEVEPGDIFLIFNSQNVLEVGIHKGNAAQLLGLEFESLISIQFEKKES